MAPVGQRFDLPCSTVLPDQSRQLRQAQPGDLAQVGPNQAPMLFALSEVLRLDQRLLQPGIDFASVLSGEPDLLAGAEKLGHLG